MSSAEAGDSYSSSESSDLQTEPEKLVDNNATKEPVRRWGGGGETDESVEKPSVLEPNHPLLVQFQQTLRAHLLEQTGKLSVEVMELEASIKEQEKAREMLGIAVYDRQQEVCRQTNKLDECQKQLTDLLAERDRQEHELVETKKKHQNHYETFRNEDHKERQLRTELEGLALLEQQLSKWKVDMESELSINQRISDKTLQEKRLLTEEKKRLDMLIYTLMTEVWKSEAELTEMDMQLRVTEKKREELGFALQDGHANLEAIGSQEKGLVRAWNNVLLSLQRRDTKYAEAQDTVKEIHIQMKTLKAELDGFRKSIDKEMQENLRLTGFKDQIETDIQTITQLKNAEESKQVIIEGDINNTQTAMEATERDLQSVNAINLGKENEMKIVQKEIDRLGAARIEIEDKIMNALDECVTNDKAAKYLNTMVRQLKEKTRSLEIQMINAENTDAKILVEIEHQRGVNAANAEYLANLQCLYNAKDASVNKLCNELHQLVNAAAKKQRVVDNLQKRLTDLVAQIGGQELSPQELRINELERGIEETDSNIVRLEALWMTQQTHIVSLSQQRNDQLHEINKLRKQIMILSQKNLYLEDEMEKHNKREAEMCRNVEKLTKRLEKLDSEIANHKDMNVKADTNTALTQSKYICQLQDAERACSQLETDIADLDQEKQSLTQQLIEVNRDALTWERQAIMATEARKNIEKEKASSGDIGAMRNEIHRMHVRYGQLRRAQERLIVDLEYCVTRRDGIINSSFAREKASQSGLAHTRIHFERKCIDMRAKIKQVLKDTEDLKILINANIDKEIHLQNELKDAQTVLKNAITHAADLHMEVENRELKKQRNLDKLIHRQRKAKRYSEVLKGVYKPRPKNILDIETMKQGEMVTKLTAILKCLIKDFPQQQKDVQKILNCLTSKV